MTTAPVTTPASAPVALASQIAIPTRLPATYKGESLAQLSYAAAAHYLRCPEDFRRSVILGERGPIAGERFLDARVNDAISGYYEHQLGGDTLSLDQLKDLYNDRWRQTLTDEADRHGGVQWARDTPEDAAKLLGLLAIELTFEQLVPQLGRPLAARRHFEFRLHPDLEWSIVGDVDLDTIREQTVIVTDDGEAHPLIWDQGQPEPTALIPYHDTPAELRPPVERGGETLEPAEALAAFNREWERYEAELSQYEAAAEPTASRPHEPAPLPEIAVPAQQLAVSAVTREVTGLVNHQVRDSLLSAGSAARDMQAGLFLAERWLAGEPVFDFRFAQVAKPKPGQRVAMSTALVATRRSEHDMRRVLARIAQTAASICATYERFGPDQPWGYAAQEATCEDCHHGPRGSDRCPFALTAHPGAGQRQLIELLAA